MRSAIVEITLTVPLRGVNKGDERMVKGLGWGKGYAGRGGRKGAEIRGWGQVSST